LYAPRIRGNFRENCIQSAAALSHLTFSIHTKRQPSALQCPSLDQSRKLLFAEYVDLPLNWAQIDAFSG